MGYGFMLVYLLKLNGISLKYGLEIHHYTYVFWTAMKKSKKDKFETIEGSVSSSAPLPA